MFGIYKIIFYWVVGIFLLSIIGAQAFPKISNYGLGSPSQTQDFNYWRSLAQWDGGNYVEIASNGYSNAKYTAFSPLYPILIKVFSQIFHLDKIISGIAISISSFLAFIYFFHKYSENIYGKKIATDIILTFLFFPTAFFCLLVYSESLFLFLAMLSIYAMHKKRYKTLLLSMAMLPLARFMGIFLILGNFFKLAIHARNKHILFTGFLALIPFFIYLGFLQLTFGNALLFTSVQSSWGRFALDPVSTIFSNITSALILHSFSLNNLFDFALTVMFIYLLATNTKRLQSNVWIFSTLTILVPLSTGTITGIPRYALASFGAFIVLGIYFHNHPKLKYCIWALSLLLQSILFSLFITGHWIA